MLFPFYCGDVARRQVLRLLPLPIPPGDGGRARARLARHKRKPLKRKGEIGRGRRNVEGAPPSSESFSSTSNLLLQIRVFGAVDDVVLQVGGHVAEVRTVPGHTDDQVAIAVGVLLGGEQGARLTMLNWRCHSFRSHHVRMMLMIFFAPCSPATHLGDSLMFRRREARLIMP